LFWKNVVASMSGGSLVGKVVYSSQEQGKAISSERPLYDDKK
jgi:hypothetical protein